jgi:hypothetical protein
MQPTSGEMKAEARRRGEDIGMGNPDGAAPPTSSPNSP